MPAVLVSSTFEGSDDVAGGLEHLHIVVCHTCTLFQAGACQTVLLASLVSRQLILVRRLLFGGRYAESVDLVHEAVSVANEGLVPRSILPGKVHCPGGGRVLIEI